jgi:hypothetical protein
VIEKSDQLYPNPIVDRYCSVSLGEQMEDLLAASSALWSSFISGDFPKVEISLSPNCQIRHHFHEEPIVSGILLCLDHLKELHSKLKQPSSKLDIEHMQHLRLMKSGKQTRFMIFGKSGYANSNYGLSFDWSCGLVIEIVIIRNTSASTFFVNETPTPSRSADSDGTFDLKPADSGVMLIPPYLVPRPPVVPATLTVTVMECRNLKSRLIRLIERYVSSYVIVEFCGVRRRTETVRSNNSPGFNVHNSFIFEFNDQQRKASVHFTVMDEHLINDDLLSTTEIPLEALPNRLDSSTPADITLPLILQGNLLDDSIDSRNRTDEYPPALIVRVSKVDAQEWWFAEEIKARAAAEARRMERLEELEREVHSKYSLSMKTTIKRGSDVILNAFSTDPPVDSAQGREPEMNGSSKEHWLDSDQVLMCME